MPSEFMTEEEWNFFNSTDICDCCGEPCKISENQLISICDFCKMD